MFPLAYTSLGLLSFIVSFFKVISGSAIMSLHVFLFLSAFLYCFFFFWIAFLDRRIRWQSLVRVICRDILVPWLPIIGGLVMEIKCFPGSRIRKSPLFEYAYTSITPKRYSQDYNTSVSPKLPYSIGQLKRKEKKSLRITHESFDSIAKDDENVTCSKLRWQIVAFPRDSILLI
jgi:hypothetical protein